MWIKAEYAYILFHLVKKIKLPAILLIALDADGTFAQAKTVRISKTVSSGKRVLIDRYIGWNNDCRFQIINIDVVH